MAENIARALGQTVDHEAFLAVLGRTALRKRMTLHEQLVESVVAYRPGVRKLGFPGACRAAFGDLSEIECDSVLRLHPDAFRVDAIRGRITCYEVEVSHPLSDTQLDTYLEAWGDLNCESIGLRLLTISRFGHLNEVRLGASWLPWMNPTSFGFPEGISTTEIISSNQWQAAAA